MRHSLAALSLVAGLALVGCNRSPLPDPGDPGLLRLSSCGDLRDYATDVITESLLDAQYGYGWWRGAPEADAGADDGASADGPTDFTTTNVQEEGVDEIDIVKTDGNFIYVAQDRALHIVKSWPVADSELLSSVELTGWIRGLFLKGDQVVVFHTRDWDEDMPYGTRVSVFDVTDRAEPILTRQIDLEGWMADGRMIDGDVYFVMNHYLEIPEEFWEMARDLDLPEIDWDRETGDGFEAYLDRLRDEARRTLRPEVERLARDMDLSSFMPSWRDSAGSGDKELMHACSDIYRPKGIAHHGALSVVNLDLDDGSLSATALLSNGWQIYASRDNLYVAQSSHWWWGWRSDSLETHIHKFALSADAEPAYTASGAVSGYAYDQFAFSEYEGHLRVATSDMDWWWGWRGDDEDRDEPGNNVFVLRDDGRGVMEQVGAVTGIAPGERIFATRYMGERGYMVTFEMVDPLFTLDLSDPTDPRVVGELKIPGFSSYLHPMGDGHLLAVGVDGDDEGNLGGLAFSVFDVSDPANPTRAHYLTLEGSDWSWSEALWDHHAFTYHRDVLSVPMYEYHWDGSEDSWFSGVISLNATAGGLSEVGRVDHRDMVRDSECLWSRWWGYDGESCYEDYWYASVRRSIYIEDNLFSLSNYGLKVTDLNDPTTQHARVLFFERAR